MAVPSTASRGRAPAAAVDVEVNVLGQIEAVEDEQLGDNAVRNGAHKRRGKENNPILKKVPLHMCSPVPSQVSSIIAAAYRPL